MTTQTDHKTFTTTSPSETIALGEALGRSLVGGTTIALVGPLGAGKTHLVKGIATGNGGPQADAVTSPTFTLINEYPGRFTLYHIDAYRLGDASELIALGFEELIGPDCAVVVEWADRVIAALPHDLLRIELQPTGETGRTFSLTALGPMARQCLASLIHDDR